MNRSAVGRLAAVRVCLALAAALASLAAFPQAQPYFPGATWLHKTPSEARIDGAQIKAAIDAAIAGESKQPRDLVVAHYQTFGREPFGHAVGPFKERGDPTGIVVHRGYIVAEWGEPARVDMTFSVTKSFLSSVVGVAFDRGMIASLDDTVREYVAPIVAFRPAPSADRSDRLGASDVIAPFETVHNRAITWNDLLRQVSDWEGTLWGKPDWADRPGRDPSEWLTRARNKPGSVYKYNDVRVNVLALAALQVWRRPLPQVLKETVMDPIGAMGKWRWFGYDNSWVVMDGAAVQSVSGGGHWGGGMFIDAYDMARFGYLTLRHGRWKDRQILSDRWVDAALTPTPAQPTYGFMNWYLNTGGKLWPSAPHSAFAHIGNGVNIVYVDSEHDLVVVLRWIENDAIDGVLARIIAAVERRALAPAAH